MFVIALDMSLREQDTRIYKETLGGEDLEASYRIIFPGTCVMQHG